MKYLTPNKVHPEGEGNHTSYSVFQYSKWKGHFMHKVYSTSTENQDAVIHSIYGVNVAEK